MIAQRARLVTAAVAIADQLALCATYLLSRALVSRWLGGSAEVSAPGWLFVLLAPLWALALAASHLYGRPSLPTWRQESSQVGRAVVAASLGMGLLAGVMPALWSSRATLALWVVLGGPALLLARRGARTLALGALGARFVLVAGGGADLPSVVALVRRAAPWGLRLVGVATDVPRDLPAGIACLGSLDEVPRLVEQRVVDEVVLVLDHSGPEAAACLDGLLAALEERGVTVHLPLRVGARRFAAVSLDRLGATPLVTLTPTVRDTWPLLVRHVIEPAVALVLLVALSPLLLVIAVAIKLTSPGPVLFRQTRCGLHGRPFTFLKFRSMYAGAERLQPALAPYNEMDGPVFKMTRDPRVTPLGRWLRRTSLDELPQLWNIVRGEMSFVGPRPAVPDEVARYEPWQRRRLSVKPGLTGLWQVSGRSDLSFEGWIRLDLEYIDHRTIREDLKILLRTIPAVLRGRGAW